MKAIKNLCGILGCLILLMTSSCQDKLAKEELAKFRQAESLKADNIMVVKSFYKYLV